MTRKEKYRQVKREAIATGLALAALIVYWLFAGFGAAHWFVRRCASQDCRSGSSWVRSAHGRWRCSSSSFCCASSFLICRLMMRTMGKLSVVLPLLAFMGVMLALSFAVRVRWQKGGAGFVSQYFVGNRALGGFVLAMTTVATYSSVSSFVGGPGMAWKVGFGWIYMAVVQVTAIFLVLFLLGTYLGKPTAPLVLYMFFSEED